jgi:hypothetical protein
MKTIAAIVDKDRLYINQPQTPGSQQQPLGDLQIERRAVELVSEACELKIRQVIDALASIAYVPVCMCVCICYESCELLIHQVADGLHQVADTLVLACLYIRMYVCAPNIHLKSCQNHMAKRKNRSLNKNILMSTNNICRPHLWIYIYIYMYVYIYVYIYNII